MSDLTPTGTDPDESGTDVIEPATGLPTEARLFFGFGAFSLLLGIIYLVTTSRSSDGTEWAGVAALFFASGFALFFATFLAISLRRVQQNVIELEANEERGATDPRRVLYLPDTSIWPIGIAVGTSLTLAGVALGFWVMIPGIALLLHSVIGFAHQSRDRH